MSKTIIAASDCEKVIENFLNCSDFKLLKFDLKSFSDKEQGYLGEHYKLEITFELNEENHTKTFFLKVRPTNEQAKQDIVNETNAYPKEIFFYNILLKEYEKYGIDTSFAPKCYYTIPDKLLVLEDLTEKGFWNQEMYKVFDMDQLKSVLKSLALMHGAGLSYEEIMSQKTGQPFRLNEQYPEFYGEEKFFDLSKENALSFAWIRVVVDALLPLVDELEESEEFKAELRTLFQEKKLGGIFQEKAEFRMTTGHSDLWSNNMLFKTECGKISRCVLVDFQLSRYFYSVFDVILMIYCNTRRDFRQKHLKELYDYYYKTLSEILSQHGCDINQIYPEDVFRKTLKISEYDAKIHAASSLSFSCTPQNYLEDYSPEERTKIIFFNRRSFMMEYFKSDEKYRKLIFDCLYDLHDVINNE